VFSQTHADEITALVRVLRRAGVSGTFLEPQFDVDTPQDLANLIKIIDQLETSGADWFPESTRNVLHEKGIITLLTQTKNL
jgi:hypothetical protein